MKVRVALLTGAIAMAGATLLALTSVPASAQSTGPYVGIGGGASWIGDADVKGLGSTTSMDFDTGYAALLKGGYALGNGLRPELELGFRTWGADGANGGASAGGDLRQYSVFANLMYDFMPTSNWSPYVGAGLGGVEYSARSLRAGTATSTDKDTTWAAQGIAGLWYAIDPNWLVSADYRFQYTGDTKLGTNVSGAVIEPDNMTHTVMLGLTYRFGSSPAPMPQPAVAAPPPPKPAPAPMPAAAPAPKVPETYVVFFAFDKSDITPVASQVLDRAVADFKATGMTNVKIEGNADRSGSDKYNLRLSQRRADAVAAYLRSKGIGGGAIQTVANGESKPLVPTADGVRNDENRNAQIFLRK